MTAVETSATLRQAPIVPSNTHDVLWPELDKPNPRSAPLGNRSINEQSLSCSPHLRKYHHASGRAHTTVRGNFGRAYAGWRSKPGTRTELEYDAEARELWRRFLEIPAYQNYRTRQPKKGKKKEEAVWPDRREWAFFRGNISSQMHSLSILISRQPSLDSPPSAVSRRRFTLAANEWDATKSSQNSSHERQEVLSSESKFRRTFKS